MFGWRKKIVQARALDMARGIEWAAHTIGNRYTLYEEVPFEEAFEVLTELAGAARQASLESDGATTANDIAQDILWVVEGMRSNNSHDERVSWMVIVAELQAKVVRLRASTVG